MRSSLGLLLLLALAPGCRQRSATERACLANDPSAKVETCFSRARLEAYQWGAESGDRTGYADGYAQCEADLGTGDTGDTGDTGAR